MDDELLLEGLDGANPLGFLALLGTVSTAAHFAPRLATRWVRTGIGWRPAVSGHGRDRIAFADAVCRTLAELPAAPFDIDAKLPFELDLLRGAMKRTLAGIPDQRRMADLLAGLGTDAHGEDGVFADTRFRLVRSGDAAGQGFPAYAMAARRGLSAQQVQATLFEAWRYNDDCFSLRWDPVEDQRYALRADDPSNKANKRAGSRGVKAANALGCEALALLPVQPLQREAATTGFAAFSGRTIAFTWPIWDRPCGLDVIRSLLADPELSLAVPKRWHLEARGIAQVFRAERLSPNVYYKNFAPAQPV